MKLQTTASCFTALAIGIVQMYLLVFCWAYIAIYNPLPSSLIAHGVHGTSLQSLLFVIDFLLSLCLSLPAAYCLIRLRPRNLALYLGLAIVPAVLWQNRLLLGGEPMPLGFSAFLPGLLSELLVLPAAVFVLLRTRASVTPNNSFKPKPLRGSA
jgi:hypothetical protein